MLEQLPFASIITDPSQKELFLLKQWDFSSRLNSRYEKLAYDGNVLWTSNFDTHDIMSLALDDKISVQSSISDPSGGWAQYGLTWDGRNLWSCSSENDMIHKHSNDDALTIIEEYQIEGRFPYALGWDGKNIWCFCARMGPDVDIRKMYKLSEEGVILNTYDVEGFDQVIYDLAWDGSSFWVTTWNGSTIYKCGIVNNKFAPIQEYDVHLSYRIGIIGMPCCLRSKTLWPSWSLILLFLPLSMEFFRRWCTTICVLQ